MGNLINWLAANAGLVVCVGLVVLVLGYFGYGLYLKYTNFMRIQIEYKELEKGIWMPFLRPYRHFREFSIGLFECSVILLPEGFAGQKDSDGEQLNSNLYNVRRIVVDECRLDIDYNNDETCKPLLVTPVTVTYSSDGRDWLFRDKTLREETFYFTR